MISEIKARENVIKSLEKSKGTEKEILRLKMEIEEIREKLRRTIE